MKALEARKRAKAAIARMESVRILVGGRMSSTSAEVDHNEQLVTHVWISRGLGWVGTR